MRHHSWTSYGFWVVLGFSAGMMVANFTVQPTLKAAGTTSRYNEHCMATGLSNAVNTNVLWLLDYEGARVVCISLNPLSGRFGGMSEVDLADALGLGNNVGDPHFMMVTGQFVGQNVGDICYVAETTSHNVLVLASPQNFDPNGRQLRGITVVDRFSYLPQQR